MADTPQQQHGTARQPRATPRRESRAHDLSLALFLAGIVAFTPPMLMVFDRPALLLGVPVIYLYLFAVWALLIGLAGRTAWRSRRRPPGGGRRGG